MNDTCPRCLSSTFAPMGKDACEFCYGRTVYHRQAGRGHSTVHFEDTPRPEPVGTGEKVANINHGKRRKR